MSFKITRYIDKETLNEYFIELVDSGFSPKIKGNVAQFTGNVQVTLDMRSDKMCIRLTSNREYK